MTEARGDPEARSFLTPGGKVDPEAVRAFYEQAADGEVPVLTFVLQRDHNTRLDKYLTSRLTHMSRAQIQRLVDDGFCTVNGRVAKPASKLRDGDSVEIHLPRPPSGEIEPEDIPIDVLFEDDHLIVLNKRPDIIVHPARSENSGTMVHALAFHFANRSGGGLSEVGREFARPGVVHRLDRRTSGCIVFAKDDRTHWQLGSQFERRLVDKRYLAVVEGNVLDDIRVLDYPIGPHPSRVKGYRERQVVRHDDLGKPSVTICRVREQYRVGQLDYALVELELKTGRTHQIRVHMSHIGHPIVGDDMYGGRPFLRDDGSTVIERQALHAALLAFEHPITGEPMVFSAGLGDDLVGLIEVLRAGECTPVHAEGTVPLARFGL